MLFITCSDSRLSHAILNHLGSYHGGAWLLYPWAFELKPRSWPHHFLPGQHIKRWSDRGTALDRRMWTDWCVLSFKPRSGPYLCCSSSRGSVHSSATQIPGMRKCWASSGMKHYERPNKKNEEWWRIGLDCIGLSGIVKWVKWMWLASMSKVFSSGLETFEDRLSMLLPHLTGNHTISLRPHVREVTLQSELRFRSFRISL